MAPKGKTQLTITLKPKKLTARERARLRKAIRTVTTIMDQHDLNKVTLDGGSCQRLRHHGK